MLAAEATPAVIEARLAMRLGQVPRDWVVIDGVLNLAEAQGIRLSSNLATGIGIARDADFSYLALASSCAACAWDPADCSLSEVVMCQVPVAMTPVGDVAGVARAGVAYTQGNPVDQTDLGLSVVGLGATAAVVVTGGSSGVVKAGAGLAKLAYRMGRLSPRLLDMATDAVRRGIDWAALPHVRGADDLVAAVRVDAFIPLSRTLFDLDRLRAATDIPTVLHLLPMVDDAADARRLADVAQTLGPRTIGAAEFLGKARLMRAAFRLTKAAWIVIGSAVALVLGLAGLVGHLLQMIVWRWLRRAAHARPI